MADAKTDAKLSHVEPADRATINGHHRANGTAAQPIPHAPDDGKIVTYEEYMADYYENHMDANYEWNDGVLEAKPVASLIQSKLHLWFLILLNHYLDENPVAEMMLLEIGFDLRVPNQKRPGQLKDAVRKPDIGIVRNDNPVVFHPNDRKYKGICDICVESISTSARSEIERDITDKKSEYAFVGVKEYYILDPEGKHMFFYELTTPGTYTEMQPDSNGVISSTVLPGFQFRVEDLYSRPDYKDIALEPPYRGYLMLDYQRAILRVEEVEAQLESTTTQLESTTTQLESAEAQLQSEIAARKALEEELARYRSQSE